MDEKRKRKSFHRIMNSLHPGTTEIFNGDDGLRAHCLELLKDQRESILSAVPEPGADDPNSIGRFEEALRAHMNQIIQQEKRKWRRRTNKELAKERKAKADFLNQLESLRANVYAGETLKYKVDQKRSWGGSGVIVTADPKYAATEDVFGLWMKDPRAVVWFMEFTRDASGAMIDRSAYYVIAKAAAEFLETHPGQGRDDKNLVLTLIDKMMRFGT